ncbi:hypothetical protein JTB14_008326 [Gonioctena quinquepunctata]|nr:hypothetical protein JTB14_008326 [Gonioctena quinquepunctata]
MSLYGEVRINEHSTRLQLNIELTVGNAVQHYNGKIELLKPKEQVIQDIIYYKPIIYRVLFPVWRRIPPKITRIAVNGNLICTGSEIPSR